ncbi:hypothetical protein ACQ4PT_003471 [Festuca glaucescens]
MGSRHQEENWGGANTNFQRSANFNNGNRFGFGGNQQRWNTGRGGSYQHRFRDNGAGAPARSGFDVDRLQQTVQAVVAAVTAATKISEPAVATPQVAAVPDNLAGGTGQHAVMSVAAPNAIPQQTPVIIQGVQDTQGDGAKGKDNEGQGPVKKKKEDKTGCFRCKQPGHYIDDCPMPFCDLCESIHHAAPACHLLQAPKPTTIIHGYANEAPMFFELPCGAFKAKVENPKLAKVTVDGDAMTIPEIIEQLKKIVPSDKFNWEVFHFRENIFRVKLPSKQEVQRLKNFGTYICTDRESCLTFDLWSSLEEPLYTLPEVWVRVSGLPNDIRSDYLSLWGVGTLFGKTLDVDMAYTRNNKVLRTKIGCLDRNLIPADSDVFIRRGFFKLRFVVEAANGSQEVNMVEANNDSTPRKSTSGLPQVGILAVGLVADREELQVPAAAARPLADAKLRMHAQAGKSVPSPGSQRALQQPRSSKQEGGRWAAATCMHTDRGFPQAGSAVAGEAASTIPAATSSTQKIRRARGSGPVKGMHATGYDQAMIANDQHMIGADGVGAPGSSVLQSEKGKDMASVSDNLKYGLDDNMVFLANITSNFVPDGSVTFDAGSVLHPSLVGSLEQQVDGAREDHIMDKKEEAAKIGLQSPMGNASSMKTNGG